jgi:ABC-type dipeptide/oligopeptide/nickel transport system permease component
MFKFTLKRLLTALIVLLILTLVVFLMTRLIPSNPAIVYVGPKAPPEVIARVTAELGLDRPIFVQYFEYLGGLFAGDWGNSLSTKRPVLLELATRLPATLELITAAMAIAAIGGVTLGVLAVRRPGKFLDGAIRFLSIGGVSMPAFWLGLLLQLFFVGNLKLLPATGQFSNALEYTNPITTVTNFALFDSLITGNWIALTDGLQHMVLPAITLAAYPLGLMARMVRSAMLEVLGQDHIFTARAYGLKERVIHWKLALKNALPSTVTVFGLSIAYALTGTFFVEVVFNWPGIGQFITAAMVAVDYPTIMAVTLLGAAAYLLSNFVVDVVQAKIDPRVRIS